MEETLLCPGVLVEIHPNSEVRTFHVRTKLLKTNQVIGEYDDNPKNTSTSVLTKALILNLREARGVKKVTCWPYEIFVEKAQMYTWEEMEDEFRLIFAKYLP